MMNTQTVASKTASYRQTSAPNLRSMPNWQATALFAISAAGPILAFHLFRPFLLSLGYDSLTSLLGAMTVPLALLFVAALVGYHRVDGYPLNWKAFSERMRFPRITWKHLLWSLILFAVGMTGYYLFAQISLSLVNKGIIPLPTNLPILVDPRATFTIDTLNQAAGGSIRGRWDIVVLYLVMFFFNIVGEELWWRGYILPRQELATGRATWLVHGLLWTFFHIYKWWDMIGLLPVCLVISFGAQRLKTNWPGLIAHALINGFIIVFIISAVIG